MIVGEAETEVVGGLPFLTSADATTPKPTVMASTADAALRRTLGRTRHLELESCRYLTTPIFSESKRGGRREDGYVCGCFGGRLTPRVPWLCVAPSQEVCPFDCCCFRDDYRYPFTSQGARPISSCTKPQATAQQPRLHPPLDLPPARRVRIFGTDAAVNEGYQTVAATAPTAELTRYARPARADRRAWKPPSPPATTTTPSRSI